MALSKTVKLAILVKQTASVITMKKAGQKRKQHNIPFGVISWVIVGISSLTIALCVAASATNPVVNTTRHYDDSLRPTPMATETSTPKSSGDSTPKGKQSEIPVVAAPHGIDAGNRFIAQASSGSASSGGGSVYDPLRRIVKIVETRGGTVTSTKQFVWAGDQLAEERDASGNVTKRFFDMGEQISGTNYYYTRDHNDSVREMTDGSGAVQSSFTYDPFGRPTQIAGTGAVPDFGYAGMYVHKPSGLNLAVDRAYSPTLGRWMSRDPIDDPTFGITPGGPEPADPGAMLMSSGFGQAHSMAPDANLMTIQMVSHDPMVQSQLASAMHPTSPQVGGLPQTNPYTYVANNPINQRDPSGLLMTSPPKPGPTVCPATGNDAYDKCVAKCKRDYAGNAAVIARCIWFHCRKYLGED